MFYNVFLLSIGISVFFDSSTTARIIKEGHKTLIADGAKIERLETGFGFVEGPVADKIGNIYFTDIRNNKIFIWTIDNQLQTFRENSGAANGLSFLNDSTLIVCEGGNRRLTAITLDGNVTVLAEEFEGKKLNSPNDVWIDPQGGIYFSDPRYGDRENLVLDGEYVFYLTPDRKNLINVVDDLIRPNGVLGTPDGKLLYVADRSADSNFVYTINNDGTLSDKTFFSKEGSDGMTMDSEGNIYITSPRKEPNFHVSIYSPKGLKLEEIITPEKPANVHFGGKDGKILFITARTSLYAVKMRVKGMPGL
jgi:gluconolactonase